MKAMFVPAPGGPEAIVPTSLPIPLPMAGDVTIDVSFAGVGLVDTFFRRGIFPLAAPHVPGIEVSGRVRAVGEGVVGLAPGQLVAAFLNDFVNLPGNGGYAEVAVARAALTIPLPAGLSLATGASIVVNGTTALMAIRHVAKVQPGETVLVLGATGGVGCLLGQLLSQQGPRRLIAGIGSRGKATAARANGYTESVLVPEHGDFGEIVDGVDVVFDMVGGPARQHAHERTREFGRLIVLGNASGQDSPLSGNTCWIGNKSVEGLNLGGLAHHAPPLVASAARELLEYAAQGRIHADPVVFQLEDASRAHAMLEQRRVRGKAILQVGIG